MAEVKNMPYEIIHSSSLTDFEKKVNQKLQNGYELIGGLSVEFRKPETRTGVYYNQTYYQAVYKK
jgi:hypothetical protein